MLLPASLNLLCKILTTTGVNNMEKEFAEKLYDFIMDYIKDHPVPLASVIGGMELVKQDIIDENKED